MNGRAVPADADQVGGDPDSATAPGPADAAWEHDGHRDLYRTLAASVAVVTADTAAGPTGMTASSVMAVSLDPPLLVVSLAHGSGTLAAIRRRRWFAVNLLAEDQRPIAARFAQGRPGWVKFSGVDLAAGSPPVLDAALAGAVCHLEWTRRCGDHTLVLGRIVRHWSGPGSPLIWHRSDYHRVAPGASA